MGWGETEYRYDHLRCITGGRKKYEAGDPYPRLWLFDPFTGMRLQKQRSDGAQKMTAWKQVLPNLDYECVPAQYSRGKNIQIRTLYVLIAAFVVLQIVLLLDLL